MKIIEGPDGFCDEIEKVFRGIEKDCLVCNYPDCVGLIWLIEEEVERLYNLGVPLIQVNNGPTFLHSFSEGTDGKIELAVRYPSCKQLSLNNGIRRCLIYQNRPFNCRIYPLGLETTGEGVAVWALHLDCLFIANKINEEQLEQIKQDLVLIIDHLHPSLVEEILSTYLEVEEVICFPDGENRYVKVREVKKK